MACHVRLLPNAQQEGWYVANLDQFHNSGPGNLNANERCIIADDLHALAVVVERRGEFKSSKKDLDRADIVRDVR
jgi:hypothetical protein